MLEEPVVWAITQHKNAVGFAELISSQASPALRNQGSLTSFLHGFKDQVRHGVWIIHNDRAEADVHWGRAGGEELGKGGIGLVV